jgi:hypothetical protein
MSSIFALLLYPLSARFSSYIGLFYSLLTIIKTESRTQSFWHFVQVRSHSFTHLATQARRLDYPLAIINTHTDRHTIQLTLLRCRHAHLYTLRRRLVVLIVHLLLSAAISPHGPFGMLRITVTLVPVLSDIPFL